MKYIDIIPPMPEPPSAKDIFPDSLTLDEIIAELEKEDIKILDESPTKVQD